MNPLRAVGPALLTAGILVSTAFGSSGPKATFTVTPSPAIVNQTALLSSAGSSCGSKTPCQFVWQDANTSRVLGKKASLTYKFLYTGTKHISLKVYDGNGHMVAAIKKDVKVVLPAPPPVTTPTTPTPPVTTPTNPTPPVTAPTSPPVTTPTTPTVPVTPTPPATDCTAHATTSTFAAKLAATNGGTLCLAAGSYSTFTGVAKSAMTTIQPETGAAVSMNVNLDSNASDLTLNGMSIGGWLINGSHDITISNSKFTAPIDIVGGTKNITFDTDTFNNLGQGTWEGRLNVEGNAANTTIKNSHFSGGCADGIFVSGNSTGTLISGNEFTGILQASCSPAHIDPIQLYGSDHTTITGNYFHNNSTGIMSPDGNGSPFTVTENVFAGTGEYPWGIVDGGGTSDVIRHNTLTGGYAVEVGRSNAGSNSSGETVRDNIVPAGVQLLAPQPSSGVTQDHNVFSNPTFVGGASPTTYASFHLAAGSPGKSAASDGSDVGI